jgi:hypothetical protein
MSMIKLKVHLRNKVEVSRNRTNELLGNAIEGEAVPLVLLDSHL